MGLYRHPKTKPLQARAEHKFVTCLAPQAPRRNNKKRGCRAQCAATPSPGVPFLETTSHGPCWSRTGAIGPRSHAARRPACNTPATRRMDREPQHQPPFTSSLEHANDSVGIDARAVTFRTLNCGWRYPWSPSRPAWRRAASSRRALRPARCRQARDRTAPRESIRPQARRAPTPRCPCPAPSPA
ncbi:hypothetical protein SDC9_165314 [bioreactor metagenome]|uniref:Uncharacterized protein n=1 Tax=bioreactor metagenome TaxID=1076179 RepID=A0A645FVU8_9ZZZZ